jgi:hypothetical protein
VEYEQTFDAARSNLAAFLFAHAAVVPRCRPEWPAGAVRDRTVGNTGPEKAREERYQK